MNNMMYVVAIIRGAHTQIVKLETIADRNYFIQKTLSDDIEANFTIAIAPNDGTALSYGLEVGLPFVQETMQEEWVI